MLKLLIGVLLCLGSSFAQSPFGIYTFKCSSAMVCVDLNVCDQFGMIAKNAVSLTEEEEAFRQPLVPCKKPDGARGVCCRDPEYKDDWPTDQNPEIPCNPPNVRLDNGRCVPPTPPPKKIQVDECPPPLIKLPNGSCGCKPPLTLVNGKCEVVCKPPQVLLPNGKCGTECKPPQVLLPGGKCGTVTTTTTTTTTRAPTTTKKITTTIRPPSKIVLPPPIGIDEAPGCPRRNRTAMPDLVYKPYDSSDFEAGAGEFPWQGAVFTSAGQFLCGCYNTQNSTCTTTASCVKGYKPSDLIVVVGVYNIANLKAVADKPPQSSVVKHIAFDPQYSSSTGKYDIAILHLVNRVKYNYYTKAICLDNYYAIPFESYDDCVVTGWGNGDTVHYVDVVLLSEAECKKSVPGFDAKAMACAKPNHEVCRLAEFGGGFHCRETGKRNKKSSDVYLLKGTYSAVTSCDSSQVITFSRIDFDWFEEALYNPLKYPLRG
uniref:CSON014394 protein n=1 Tax=Culicoides sonorensis TaxID=179676 RepID=A0A336KSQ0_CULSO